MFRVNDQHYEITSACLELFDEEGDKGDIICWGLMIKGKGSGPNNMAQWDPAILSDILWKTTPGQVSHWYEIAGTTIAWNEPNEDPQALFEVFETEAIYNCKWQFVRTLDGAGVRLLFEGMVDVDVDHIGLKVAVDTKLGVAPWPMGRLSEQDCHDRFRQLGFKDPVKYQIDGWTVSSLVFLNQ